MIMMLYQATETSAAVQPTAFETSASGHSLIGSSVSSPTTSTTGNGTAAPMAGYHGFSSVTFIGIGVGVGVGEAMVMGGIAALVW